MDELAFGRDLKIADNLERLEKAASKGNVAAMKHLATRFDLAPERMAPMRPPKQEKLGKKAQAQVDAENPDITVPMGEMMARRAGSSRLN
ncbi:MAG: hypothetical protein AB7I42_26630 [Bradyrhizobium sp.]|uniref:hypothetical protein n=1 Tax=Bradyrhizobium sp. TaxID=376 RepID=UPI003D0BA374